MVCVVGGRAQNHAVLVAVMPESDGGGRVRPLADDGIPSGPEERVADLAGRIGELERTLRPRWLWPATADCYPALLAQCAEWNGLPDEPTT